MSKNLINLSIILPTINESENLKKLIPEIVTELSNSNIDNYEILVLDDGSTDDTVSYIEQFNKTNSNVIIKNRISEPSLPMAIYDGIDQSKYDHVMWLDADGSMPAKTIREMVNKQTEQFDAVIIGSRFVEGGGYKGIQQIGKTSFLSAKKLKFVFVKLKSLYNWIFKSFTFPLAIKLFNDPSSSKNISISLISLPSCILLFKKLLKLDGLIIADNLFNCLISNSSKIRFVFFIFGFDFNNDKKSMYTFKFFIGTEILL